MKRKKLLTFICSIFMIISLLTACTDKKSTPTPNAGKTKKSDVKVGLSTDVGGRGDKSFNDAAIAGLDRIKTEYGIEPDILEAKKPADYDPFLSTLASKDDLVFGIGYAMKQSITNAAKANTGKKFAIVDEEVKLPNVVSIKFKEEEGSFLMGVIAGKMTKTNKVGFIGGVDLPLIEKFQAGFAAGVKAVNQTASTYLGKNGKNVIYVGAFDNPQLGKEAARKLYQSGCDVIFHAAGGSGTGLLEEAHEERAAKKDVWAIGVDSDQAAITPNAADAILSSMIKRVDIGTYDVTKSVIENKFKGNTTLDFGLKENGVGMASTTNKNTTKEVIDLATKYADKIKSGSIKVPTRPEDVAAFTTPSLK